MKISNPMDYSNPNVKKINFELKRYVLSKIIDFCSERNISFNKYETHYLKVKGSTYNHLLKDNNYRLTNYVATRLLQPILTPLEGKIFIYTLKADNVKIVQYKGFNQSYINYFGKSEIVSPENTNFVEAYKKIIVKDSFVKFYDFIDYPDTQLKEVLNHCLEVKCEVNYLSLSKHVFNEHGIFFPLCEQYKNGKKVFCG